MQTKLTLSVEKSVIDRAKKYAQQTGRSLSELVQNYLDKITATQAEGALDEKLARLQGSVQLPANFDEQEALRSNLEEKHG